MAQLHKEKYVRARDDPFFNGMRRRGEAEVISKGSGLDILKKVSRNDIMRSASDVGNWGKKKINVELSENDAYCDRHLPNSASNSIREPLGRSFSVRSSAASKMNSYLGSPQSGLKVDLHDVDESTMQSSPRLSEANGEYYSPSGIALPAYEISYSVAKRDTCISNIPLPPSAALFYSGNSVQMDVVKSCQGIHRLNNFLKARRDDVSAGIPSRFLHAVIGPDCWGNLHEPFIVLCNGLLSNPASIISSNLSMW